MFRKGDPRPVNSGRKKGTVNKLTQTATEIMNRLGHDPIENMVLIAKANVPCAVCHGRGKTKYQPALGEDRLLDRTCQSCYGSGKEKISPELRGRMNAELAKYRYPTLRQIEHTGTALENRPAVQIMFVEGPKPVPSVNIHSLESPAAAAEDTKVFSPVNKTIIPTFTK